MHILFLTDNFPPETNAPASRTFEHAREWVAAGHEVTVITCAPNFPNGRVFCGYRNRLWQQEDMAGIRVIRVWSYMTGNEGFALRILDFVSFMLSSFLAALFVRKPDVIVGTSPQFFTTVAAWAAGAIKRKPFVFELRDIWPESIRAVGVMEESRALDLLEKLELFLYRRAAAVVSVTHSFKRNLISRGIDENKLDVVTNGVDSSSFHQIPKDAALAVELNIEGCFVAGYIGTHGMAHALETLLDAAAILQDDPQAQHIRILFLGHGAARNGLMARAEELGLTNVIFRASVPRNAVPAYWSLLDAALIHLRRTELFKTVIPSKMFECMGMGIPIILGVEGEAAEIVRQTGAGITIEPENSQQLAEQLKTLSCEPQTLKEMSSAGVDAAQRYDRTALARSMLTILKRVAK
ncbi:glycosyltransferase family 4 protein [Sulfitobacter sp. 1A12057]|uniref:glycosyltransferase family 4 protein n=1 Tax=Sulfitobacter sp. 1A12057 TaxID=3368567 RepID=UPI00374689F5